MHLHREDENMHKPKKVVMAALLMCIVILSVGSVMAKQQTEKIKL